jgi:hypothetical protein
MPKSWSHPRIGTLTHDDIWWRREIVVPSLTPFTYVDVARRGYNPPPEPFELVLQCESEEMEPNEEMASLAATILDNESRLVPRLLDAVWADLNGRGPDSGMWWHGDLPNAYRGGNWASVAFDALRGFGLPVPTSAEDLLQVLRPDELTIRRDFSPPKPWIGEFSFYSGFDVEHGVGVLTDGVDILGVGYSSDATRFKG